MRILVTGGAGFVGSHIVDFLAEADPGHQIVVLDSLVAHPDGPPPWLRDDVQYVEGDVRDPEAWRRAVSRASGLDAICHQAARVGLGVDFGDVRTYVDDNAAGTAAGLWVLHDLGFRGRIVLASSMVVYGEGRYRCGHHGAVRPGPRTRGDLYAGRFEPPCPHCGRPLAWAPIDEDAPLDPRNVYAATKLHQEQLCQIFGREHEVPVTALRYHNVYGPRMPRNTPYAGVASIFRSAVERGEAPRVFEDGAQTRDFVHVRDVARANVAALTVDEPVDGPLNIASGTPRTILDLARAICIEWPAPEPPVYSERFPAPGHARFGETRPAPRLEPVVVGGGRLGDVRHIVASPERAAARLGFKAHEPFRPGETGR
jgi:dTDP-L-rhamnose 4-epimerase